MLNVGWSSNYGLFTGGMETESEYPYEGRDDKCAFNVSDVRVYINGSVNISKSEDGKYRLLKGEVGWR